jgi:hypothetical protein
MLQWGHKDQVNTKGYQNCEGDKYEQIDETARSKTNKHHND